MDIDYEIINNQQYNNNDVILSEIVKIKEEIKEIKNICNVFKNQICESQQSHVELIGVIKEIISNNNNNMKDLYREFDNI